jgi:preprotein translocase subunit YajC
MLLLPLLALIQETPAPATSTPAPAPSAPGGMDSLFGGMMIPLVLCMAVFYFFMIGPERKARKKREAMLKSLEKGAKVMLTSGFYGTIVGVNDQIVTVQLGEGMRVRCALSSVQSVLEDDGSTKDVKEKEKEKVS